eukprot:2077241-Heterocapsa_arctica.AAC.1
MLKAKQNQFHKREKTNTHKARQMNFETETKFEDKSDTEDNGKDVLEHFGDKDRQTMEYNNNTIDNIDSEDQSFVESSRN